MALPPGWERLPTEQIKQLYRAQVEGRLAVTPREKLDAQLRRERTAKFMKRLNTLDDAGVANVVNQLTAGRPSDKVKWP